MQQGVPDRAAAPSGSRRLDVQGLRAVAVIMVVAFHAGLPIRGGFTGVDVFLVISGFVIMGMLMRELQSTGTIRLRDFYSRRVKRLLPALALLTTIVMALSVFFGSSFGTQQTTARTGLGATYFSANVVIYRDSTEYFSPEASTNPLLNTWTLSVEEQVYLVFPSLLLGSWMLGRWLLMASKRGASVEVDGQLSGRRSKRAAKLSAFAMLWVVGWSSFVLCLLASFGRLSSPPQFAFYSSLTRIWEFAIGAGLALATPNLKRIPPKIAEVLGLAGAAAIAIGAFAISGLMPYPGFAVLVPVLGAAAVITAGLNPSATVARWLSKTPMVSIGDLSYSWYLWHWPLIVFGAVVWPSAKWALVVIGALSIIPAGLSTRYVENPIRRNEKVRGRRIVALAAVCTLVPTAAAIGLQAGASVSWGDKGVANMQAQVGAQHVAATHHCNNAAAANSTINTPGCEFNASATPSPSKGKNKQKHQKEPHAYLVGNSVASMYSEALIGASNTLNIPLSLFTSNGCFFSGDSTDRSCSDDFTSTVNKIIQRQPGVVVMSSTWDLGEYGGSTSTSDSKTPHEKAQLLFTSLSAAIAKLRAAGNQVIIVLPTPRFFHTATPGVYGPAPMKSLARQDAHSTSWRPEDCPAITAQSNPAACGATVPQAQEDSAQAITMAALQKVAEATGAVVMDLRSHFCWSGVCRTNDGTRWMFQDGIHISVQESQSLAPEFATVLKKIFHKPNWWVPPAALSTKGEKTSPSPTPLPSKSP